MSRVVRAGLIPRFMINDEMSVCPLTSLSCAQQRVEVAEARQNQMMAFLSKALQNPGMLQQLVSSRQNIGRLENGGNSSRTRAHLFLYGLPRG